MQTNIGASKLSTLFYKVDQIRLISDKAETQFAHFLNCFVSINRYLQLIPYFYCLTIHEYRAAVVIYQLSTSVLSHLDTGRIHNHFTKTIELIKIQSNSIV